MGMAESCYQFFLDMSIQYYDYNRRAFATKDVPTAALNAIMFGVPKIFVPRWQVPGDLELGNWWMMPAGSWTYFYSHAPLAKMLEKYINFGRLSNRVALATTAAGSS